MVQFLLNSLPIISLRYVVTPDSGALMQIVRAFFSYELCYDVSINLGATPLSEFCDGYCLRNPKTNSGWKNGSSKPLFLRLNTTPIPRHITYSGQTVRSGNSVSESGWQGRL